MRLIPVAMLYCSKMRGSHLVQDQLNSDICVKFFLANRCHNNWQPIHQSFMLSVTVESIGERLDRKARNLTEMYPLAR